jgi:PTS system nitrogen regulatory IIA component
MRFTEHLPEGGIIPALWARDRHGVLHELAQTLSAHAHAPVRHIEERLAVRERICSTAIGEGVAIPHCRVERLKRTTVCVAVHPAGVDFGARDGRPVRLLVTLVSPEKAAGLHLGLLTRIAALLRDAHLRQAVLETPSAGAIRSLLVQAEDAYLSAQHARQGVQPPASLCLAPLRCRPARAAP